MPLLISIPWHLVQSDYVLMWKLLPMRVEIEVRIVKRGLNYICYDKMEGRWYWCGCCYWIFGWWKSLWWVELVATVILLMVLTLTLVLVRWVELVEDLMRRKVTSKANNFVRAFWSLRIAWRWCGDEKEVKRCSALLYFWASARHGCGSDYDMRCQEPELHD